MAEDGLSKLGKKKLRDLKGAGMIPPPEDLSFIMDLEKEAALINGDTESTPDEDSRQKLEKNIKNKIDEMGDLVDLMQEELKKAVIGGLISQQQNKEFFEFARTSESLVERYANGDVSAELLGELSHWCEDFNVRINNMFKLIREREEKMKNEIVEKIEKTDQEMAPEPEPAPKQKPASKKEPVVDPNIILEKEKQAQEDLSGRLAEMIDEAMTKNRRGDEVGTCSRLAAEILEGKGKDILESFRAGRNRRDGWVLSKKEHDDLKELAKNLVDERYPREEKTKTVAHADVHNTVGKKDNPLQKTGEDFEREMENINQESELLEYLKKVDSVRVLSGKGGKYPRDTFYYITNDMLGKIESVFEGKKNAREIYIPAVRKKVREIIRKRKEQEKITDPDEKDLPNEIPQSGEDKAGISQGKKNIPQEKKYSEIVQEELGHIEKFKERQLKKISEGALTRSESRFANKLFFVLARYNERVLKGLPKPEQEEIKEKIQKTNEEITAAWEEYRKKSSEKKDEIKKDTKNVGEKKENNEKRISKERMREIERARAGSEITLALIKNYEDLNARTEQAGDENFLAKTRALWKEFAVHGFLKENKKTGELYTEANTDLDGKTALGILGLAGFNTNNLKYVAPGDYEEGRINIDTGERHGVKVEDKTKTAFFDHHEKNSSLNTSAAKEMYETLVAMGLLKKENHLDKMVNFVNEMDNARYPGIKNYFKNSWKTLDGLERFIKFSNLVKFFKYDKNPDPARELNEAELKNYGFIWGKGEKDGSGKVKGKNYSLTQENNAKKDLEKLQEMEKNGLIVESEKYGKIAIDIANGDGDKGLRGSGKAAKAYGCDTYVVWNSKKKMFSIYASRRIEENFSQGKNIRRNMWIKSPKNGEELSATLNEILEKMTGGKFEAKGKLKEYLDKEKGQEQKEETEIDLEAEKKREKYKELISEQMDCGRRYLANMQKGIRLGFVEIDLEGLSQEEKDEKIEEEFIKRFGNLMLNNIKRSGFDEKEGEFVIENVLNNLLNKK